MSRGGNCWDNAGQESFFDHMKDEIKDKIIGCITYDDWIDYYNNDRCIWYLNNWHQKNFINQLKIKKYTLSLGEARDKESTLLNINFV